MKKIGLMMSCLVGVSMIAMASEPVEKGPRTSPPMRQGKGDMRDGGGMMMLMRPMVVKQLELTRDQQAQIAAVVSSGSNEMTSLRAMMQPIAKKQAELMGADVLDENAILQLADEIGKIRSDMAKLQIKEMLAAHKILTVDQRLKLRDMMKNFMAKREGKRPTGKQAKGDGKQGSGESPSAPPPPHAD